MVAVTMQLAAVAGTMNHDPHRPASYPLFRFLWSPGGIAQALLLRRTPCEGEALSLGRRYFLMPPKNPEHYRARRPQIAKQLLFILEVLDLCLS